MSTSNNSGLPHFSVIIPARNEEDFLPSCIEALKSSALKAKAQVEYIVVINRCTDRTEDIAREAGAKIVYCDQKNLSKIRNIGCQAASADILITIDADSLVSENMFQALNKVLKDKRNGAGGVLILPERWSLGIALSMLMLVPIALYYRISAGMFFIRKEIFEEIGGFNESLVSAEDIDFAIRAKSCAKSKGMRFVNIFRASITTSCRKFDKLGDWYVFKNLGMAKELLKGRNQKMADEIWYDFER